MSPSALSQQLQSRTRPARGSTAAVLPQQTPISFARSTQTRYPWMVVPLALRANYVRADRSPAQGSLSAAYPQPIHRADSRDVSASTWVCCAIVHRHKKPPGVNRRPGCQMAKLALAAGEPRIWPLEQFYQIGQAIYRQLLVIALASRREIFSISANSLP